MWIKSKIEATKNRWSTIYRSCSTGKILRFPSYSIAIGGNWCNQNRCGLHITRPWGIDGWCVMYRTFCKHQHQNVPTCNKCVIIDSTVFSKKNLNIIFSNTNGAYIRQQFQTTSLNLKCGPCNWLRCCSSQHLAALLPLPSFLPDRGTRCEESVACQAISSTYYKSTWHRTSIYHNLTSCPCVENGYIQQYKCSMHSNSYIEEKNMKKKMLWNNTEVFQLWPQVSELLQSMLPLCGFCASAECCVVYHQARWYSHRVLGKISRVDQLRNEKPLIPGVSR